VNWEVVTIVVAAVAAAIDAGAFFVFSNFVMPALADLPAGDGATAMQSINRSAPNPLFLAMLVGAGLVAVPALVTEWGQSGDGPFLWLLAGVVLSIVSFVVTAAFNVPRNDVLDVLDARAPASEPVWLDYVVGWTRWNTVRTLTSAASVAAYALSLRGR
jgi:uncharacterized membrane protein